MMPASLRTSLTWVPTVALSWLWGLGFFYSIHVARSYGWSGFLAFAIPNAFGLFLFGWVLGSPKRDVAALVARIQGPFAGLLLLGQIAGIAVTLLAFSSYLAPLAGGQNALVLAVLLTLGACATGQAFTLARLRILHGLYLVVGLGAVFVVLRSLDSAVPALNTSGLVWDGRFYGLMLPSLIGFLLGPWTDIQQWQRAVEIRRSGGSTRLAYGLGAPLFFSLIALNATIGLAAGVAPPIAYSDGTFGEQAAPAIALAATGSALAAGAYVLWASISLVSMVDGAYNALRWLLSSVTARSSSALLAIIPATFVSSPLPIILAAVALAVFATSAGWSMIYLMMPYATIFVGPTLYLVAASLGRTERYDAVLCYLIGMAAAILFVIGYVGNSPLLVTLSSLVGLIGALPVLVPQKSAPVAAEQTALFSETSVAGAQTARLTPIMPLSPPAATELAASHGFDGDWFVMRLMPTYDDTNSVGNVYFANYVRWVGKARELFFNHCMPDFDLKTTAFYVLTRSFQHDFRREAAEFEPILVRIRISDHNRKFVTLAHEILSETHGVLGRGTQSLMFVDTKDYRPLDIPGDIVRGFLPHWPKNKPLGERAARAVALDLG